MSDFDHGPAVLSQCKGHKNPECDYPARFEGRVPKVVRIIKSARSATFFGQPGGEELIAERGREYPAWTNSHGAVAAIFPCGRRLGLYPNEFEVVEWLHGDVESQPDAHDKQSIQDIQARCDRLIAKPRSEAYRKALQRLQDAKHEVLRRGEAT